MHTIKEGLDPILFKSNKYSNMADDYRNMESPLYNAAENYFRNNASQLGGDQMATMNRLSGQNQASIGMDPRSGIGLSQRHQQNNRIASDQNRLIQGNLFNTWQKGQQMAGQYDTRGDNAMNQYGSLTTNAYGAGMQQDLSNQQSQNANRMAMWKGGMGLIGNMVAPGFGGLAMNAFGGQKGADGQDLGWREAWSRGYQYPGGK